MCRGPLTANVKETEADTKLEHCTDRCGITPLLGGELNLLQGAHLGLPNITSAQYFLLIFLVLPGIVRSCRDYDM